MFKAYFHLSMELVRDVVKTMEEGMMESFDDEASKPISSSFAVPIPSGDGPVEIRSKIREAGALRPTIPGGESASTILSQTASPTLNDSIEFSNSPTLQSPPIQRPFSPLSKPFRSRTSPEPFPSSTSPTLYVGIGSPIHDSNSNPLTVSMSHPFSPPLQSPLTNSWPIMESMSQDALAEMVNKTFASAGAQNKDVIQYEEFKLVVESDANLLAWFEALGSVF